MKTIETKHNQLNSIKLYINDAVELTNKAIAILSPKMGIITMDTINTIINTGYCEDEHNNTYFELLYNMGFDDELLKELDYDAKQLYSKLAYNKTKHLFNAKEVFKQVNQDTIKALKYITIKDNIAIINPDFESLLINDYTVYCKTTKQEQITKSFEAIIKELNKLQSYDINHYSVLSNLYLNDGKLNINSNYILSH